MRTEEQRLSLFPKSQQGNLESFVPLPRPAEAALKSFIMFTLLIKVGISGNKWG